MGSPGRGTRAWGGSQGVIWGWRAQLLCHHGPRRDDTEGVAPLWGHRDLVLGGHRDLGGSCSSLSTVSSSLCIPSGHQSQGKEDTAMSREGLGGGWDRLAQVSRQLWSSSLLFWHLLGRQCREGRGQQDVEGQSVTLGPASLCLAPGAWQRVRVGRGCCFFFGEKKGSFILNLFAFGAARAVLGCCWGRRGRGTPGCQG